MNPRVFLAGAVLLFRCENRFWPFSTIFGTRMRAEKDLGWFQFFLGVYIDVFGGMVDVLTE